ncbi:hypothetical protein NXY56_001461 [Leishmania guyanensis]
MTLSSPFTMAMEFAPDESRTVFPGSVTITKTTLTVLKRNNTAPTAVQDSVMNERSDFVGACSLPLIQFYRHKNIITLMRGSSFLFDKAAVSIGFHPGAAGSSHTDSSIRASNHSRRNNPSMWETLAIHCVTPDDCDRVVEVLLTCNAEKTSVPPLPMRSGGHGSRNTSIPASLNSYSHHNEQSGRPSSARREHHHSHHSEQSGRPSSARREHHHSHHSEQSERPSSARREHHHSHHSEQSERPSSARREHHHSRRSSPSLSSYHPASSHMSERPQWKESAQYTSPRGSTLQMELSTPRSSRLPSRRESDDAAAQSSVRIGELTPRSSRLPSRRENDDITSMTTPSQSIRSFQQRVAPGRSTAAKTLSQLNSEKQQVPQLRHHSTERKRDALSTASTSHRRLVDPAEREFATTEETRPHSRPHRHRSHSRPSASSRSLQRNGASTAAFEGGHAHRHGTPHSARGTGSVTSLSTPVSASRRYVSPRTGTMDYSASVSPRNTVLPTEKLGQDAFLRSLQRLQHHRLHFMQDLHKEMVHHAYLTEEAKVRAAMTSAKTSLSHHRTRSPTSGRMLEVTGAEATHLREIEARLAQVEALHCEAEREREEAARLRREYECRNDEMNARMGGSHNVSEPSSSVMSPRRSSVHPINGQLMVLPPQSGGGNGYPFTAHQGYMMSPEWALAADPAAAPRPDDVDLGVAIIDRYVFGEEWDRLHPAYEVDVRFNALIDICLAVKLPRRLVNITSIVVDRPGLRLTAEIRYDRAKIERDGVERRMHGCPFRFLQRFYAMRDLYDPMHDSAAALAGGSIAPMTMGPSAANGRRPSAARSRRESRALSAQRRRSGLAPQYNNSDVSEISDDFVDAYDLDARRDHYHRRADDRVRAEEDRMAKRRKRMAMELHHQLADNMAQLEEEEEYLRDRVQFAEAKERQRIGKEARSNVKTTLTTSMAHLEEEERVGRAAMEVGAARQLHVLMGGHRRKLALFGLQASEAERRKQIAAQEAHAQRDLNETMNPAGTAQRRQAEHRAREEEALARRGAMYASRQELEAAVADMEADEVAARAIIRSQAMESLLDLLSRRPAPKSKDGCYALLHTPSTLRTLLGDLKADETAQRRQIVADERHRRALYRQEDVMNREAADRGAIEEAEMDARDAIVDDMMARNRHQLERRLNDREKLLSILNEEQFYRKTILSDEQDAFEVLAELFTAGLKDLLARVPEVIDDDDEDLRRRRVSTARQAKLFHYMTFSPDDMDYPPSAVLAIEGIVGCSINKNLEVVSIARPLPKAEEDLQLQAGDMILDVAGHSLHSLSHLREVLSNRAMQIQEEAFTEFPDLPQDQLTINPALQKYVEMLCEHHNFLVQVLRGCEIYQIIVRS